MVLLAEEYPITYLNTEVLVTEVNRFFKKEKVNNGKMALRSFREKVAIGAHRAWTLVLHWFLSW